MDGYKKMLEKLTTLLNALEQGELTLEELTELESVTRQLHERSIILRHKAYEKSVLGEKQEQSEEKADVVAESKVEEAFTLDEEPEEVTEEETAFDFAIFDTETESEETIEEVVVESITRVEPEATEVITPEPKPVEEAVTEPIEPEVQEEVKQSEPSEPSVAQTGNSFLDKLSVQDNSLAGRFSAGPLTTLIGAFGLNERLRFINDLFDGSSEHFSDAIKVLDNRSNLDEARAKAAEYAQENDWDPEEEVVVEFMNYLNRRYA